MVRSQFELDKRYKILNPDVWDLSLSLEMFLWCNATPLTLPVDMINALSSMKTWTWFTFINVYFAVITPYSRDTKTWISIDAINACTIVLARAGFTFVYVYFTAPPCQLIYCVIIHCMIILWYNIRSLIILFFVSYNLISKLTECLNTAKTNFQILSILWT